MRRIGDLTVVDLVVKDGEVLGAVALHLNTGEIVTLAAKSVIIATGGLTRLYWRNSASFNMGGDGFALALRAGADLIRNGAAFHEGAGLAFFPRRSMAAHEMPLGKAREFP